MIIASAANLSLVKSENVSIFDCNATQCLYLFALLHFRICLLGLPILIDHSFIKENIYFITNFISFILTFSSRGKVGGRLGQGVLVLNEMRFFSPYTIVCSVEKTTIWLICTQILKHN